MKMWKAIMKVLSVVLCVIAFFVTGCTTSAEEFEYESEYEYEMPSEETGVLVEYTKDDIVVIPDKYNTGATGDLTEVALGETVNGVVFKAGSNDTRNVLDFYNRNTDINGTVMFENYDFSDYEIWVYNGDMVDRKIKLVFMNCKFGEINVGKEDSNLSYEFYNCSIARFVGSNATFDTCKFGESCYTDAMVPFVNVQVLNCFFGQMGGIDESGREIHTDGIQIYGSEGVTVENIRYENCRFEVPPIYEEGSMIFVNACIMLQLEYSSGRNIAFDDCWLNGGGYSIYARALKGYSLENVSFENIKTGCAKIYGTLYSDVSSGVEMNHFSEIDRLYVASVWKENGQTYFSVTNDTKQERVLRIITDGGEYEYVIPACPVGSEIAVGTKYNDFPFDICIEIPRDCQYAICYDGTVQGCEKQIRFMNWTDRNIFLSQERVNDLTAQANAIVSEGYCGENVIYSLTRSGLLTLKGQGATDNFHSAKLPAWAEYSEIIKEVVVEEGIEELGSQIFRKCIALQNVTLPESLNVIGMRAFAGCTALTSITIPAGVETIGDSAFASSVLRKIYYGGLDWNAINLGSGNESLETLVEYLEGEAAGEEADGNIFIQGACGKQTYYSMSEDGVLVIYGTGAMEDYHSQKLPPWYDMMDSIKAVVIESGIDHVGSQSFRKCKNLATVELPEGVKTIGNNAFSTCTLISSLVMPSTITEIHKYAFSSISSIAVTYNGSKDAWDAIDIGIKNEGIQNNVSFTQ